MPKKISNEVLLQAQELRTQGKSYEEISKALQVSVSWCKHNLFSALAQKKEVIAVLESKSKTRKGVSKGEITKAVNVNQPKKELIKEVNTRTKSQHGKGFVACYMLIKKVLRLIKILSGLTCYQIMIFVLMI